MRPVESYSSLKTYQTCPKLYDFTYNRGIKIDDESLASKFGTWMVHDPITTWYAARGNHAPSFDDLWEKVGATGEELANKRNKAYSIKTARFLFQEYTQRFARDFDDYEILPVEEYKIVGWYGSKPDMVLQRKADGVVLTHDLKSSKWDAILDGAAFNNQFLGQMYVWETTEAMVTLINPETLTIERIPIKVDSSDIERFKAELEMRRFQIGASEAAGCWPRNAPEACRPYNRDCPMKDLCFK